MDCVKKENKILEFKTALKKEAHLVFTWVTTTKPTYHHKVFFIKIAPHFMSNFSGENSSDAQSRLGSKAVRVQ